MRPVSANGLVSGSAKFLCTLEISNSQEEKDGVAGICCSFALDLHTGKLTQNVLQLSGRTSIYLGQLDYKDPSILVLQADMRSILIFSFDEGDLESKLPHGEIRLSQVVNGVYWSPMRDGLAVIYELQNENLLTFSKNRLERYSMKDFGILVSRNVGLQLGYEERVFDVKWTGFSLGFASESSNQTIKGVIGTNQHIYFVDEKLVATGILKLRESSLTSLLWMGEHTVIASTRDHLLHIPYERHPKAEVVFSHAKSLSRQAASNNEAAKTQSYEESDLPSIPIVVKALADRVILATQDLAGKVSFQSRPMLMLEPILLGYLSSVPQGKVEV